MHQHDLYLMYGFCFFFQFLSTDAYAVPANFLEIDVVNPMTTLTAGKKRYTDYEVRMRVCVCVDLNNPASNQHSDPNKYYARLNFLCRFI